MFKYNLVTIFAKDNPSNSFTFKADPKGLKIDTNMTNTVVDAAFSNDSYVHIRSRSRLVTLECVLVDYDDAQIKAFNTFMANITKLSTNTLSVFRVLLDGVDFFNEDLVITAIPTDYQNFFAYNNGKSLPKRAEVTFNFVIVNNERGSTQTLLLNE